MDRKIVCTKNAPAAIGPYSQAVVAGDFIFTSGQIPIDKDTKMIAGDGIEEQTQAALNNLSEVLKEAGTDLCSVVKTTVYLKDMRDFATMNKVYAGFFCEESPARSCVEVADLPMGVKVEIEAIALKK